MLYFKISAVIAAAVAILLLFVDNDLKSTDKGFIISILVLLIISGVYFDIRAKKNENADSEEQVRKLDTTLTNTENLKSKADSIINDLNESLEKTKSISDSINKQNETLVLVDSSVKEQIKTLKATLKQTEIFERKVKQQLALEEKRVESEKPRIGFNTFFSKRNNQYILVHEIRNSGKRHAVDLRMHSVIIFGNKKAEKHEFIGDLNETLGNPAPNNFPSSIFSFVKFNIDEVEGKYQHAVVKIKYSYTDELNNLRVNDTKVMVWKGLKESGLEFHYAPSAWIEYIENYLIGNKIDF
jgi:hypothetical protein